MDTTPSVEPSPLVAAFRATFNTTFDDIRNLHTLFFNDDHNRAPERILFQSELTVKISAKTSALATLREIITILANNDPTLCADVNRDYNRARNFENEVFREFETTILRSFPNCTVKV